MAKLNSLRYSLKSIAINISLGIYFDSFHFEIFRHQAYSITPSLYRVRRAVDQAVREKSNNRKWRNQTPPLPPPPPHP